MTISHPDTSAGRHADQTARALLRAVLQILFRQGVSRQSLESLCDEAYIEAASRQLRQQGPDATPEAVATLSGVSPTHLEDVQDHLTREQSSTVAPISTLAPIVEAGTRLMTAWHTDSELTDDYGRPRPLKPESAEFKGLVQHYCDGFSCEAIAAMLEETDSAVLNDDGEIVPRGRTILSAPNSEDIDHNAVEALLDLARAIDINRDKHEAHSGAIQRTCTNDRIPARVAPLFRRMLHERTQDYLEIIDDWLVQHEVREEPESSAEPLQRLGVGVYIICDH